MSKIIIELSDNEDIYGLIRVNEEDKDKIEKMITDYKDSDDEYNIDGLYEYLKDHGIELAVLPHKGDVVMYF